MFEQRVVGSLVDALIEENKENTNEEAILDPNTRLKDVKRGAWVGISRRHLFYQGGWFLDGRAPVFTSGLEHAELMLRRDEKGEYHVFSNSTLMGVAWEDFNALKRYFLPAQPVKASQRVKVKTISTWDYKWERKWHSLVLRPGF